MKSVNIMGVEVSDISRSQALSQAKSFLEDKHQHFIVTPNPEIVLQAGKDDALRRILNLADLSLPDGFGLKIGARILGQKLHNRVTGADFTESLCALAESEQWPIFLLGSLDEKTAEQAAWRLRYQYKQLKVVGHASGGVVEFKRGKWQASDAKLIDRINQSRAKIVFVGFGCPKQEKWIFHNLDKLPNIKLAVTVGGTLDFLAGERKRSITVMRKTGLEWLWRLIIQPSRIRRIWNATAVFLWKCASWSIRMRTAYRANVLAAILNEKNEFLLIRRSDSRDEHWQFPQGGVDPGESGEDAVLREAREETGISNRIEILGKHPDGHQYDYPTQWHCYLNGYKGQTQAIFYLRYSGDGRGISLDPHEASDYAWVAPQEVVAKVFHRRKKIASMIVEKYKNYADK